MIPPEIGQRSEPEAGSATPLSVTDKKSPTGNRSGFLKG
jgi:hypothetical protein